MANRFMKYRRRFRLIDRVGDIAVWVSMYIAAAYASLLAMGVWK